MTALTPRTGDTVTTAEELVAAVRQDHRTNYDTSGWSCTCGYRYGAHLADGAIEDHRMLAVVLHPRPDDPRDAEIERVVRERVAVTVERLTDVLHEANNTTSRQIDRACAAEAERDAAVIEEAKMREVLDGVNLAMRKVLARERALREAVEGLADRADADFTQHRAGHAWVRTDDLRAALAEHPAPESEPGRRDALTVTREAILTLLPTVRSLALRERWLPGAPASQALRDLERVAALGLTVTDGGEGRG